MLLVAHFKDKLGSYLRLDSAPVTVFSNERLCIVFPNKNYFDQESLGL